MILIADNIHKGCLFSIERLFRRGEIRLDLSRNTAVAMGTRPFPLAEKFLSALWRANSGLMQISYIVHVICVFALIIFIWMTGTSIYSSLQNDGLFLVVGADSSRWRFRCRFGDKWVKISSYLIFFIIMYYFSFIRLNFFIIISILLWFMIFWNYFLYYFRCVFAMFEYEKREIIMENNPKILKKCFLNYSTCTYLKFSLRLSWLFLLIA